LGGGGGGDWEHAGVKVLERKEGSLDYEIVDEGLCKEEGLL
jgi:hypothetical protein